MNLCQSCRYCVAVDDYVGECHRYPPPTQPDWRDEPHFTKVYLADWCGEYAGKRSRPPAVSGRVLPFELPKEAVCH